MSTAVIKTQIDAEVKGAAEQILAEAGLTVSEAMRMFFNKIVAEQHVSLDLFHPNAETVEAMEAARKGELLHAESLDQLMADLHAED